MSRVNLHRHYYKPTPFESVDVYRVLKLFEVTDPCIQHAIKKLLVPGAKSIDQDVQEAIHALERWQEMEREDKPRVFLTEEVTT